MFNTLSDLSSLRMLLKHDTFRFVSVGISNATISYTVFVITIHILSSLHGRAGIAQAIAYGAGIIWSFILNRNWTFRSKKPVVYQGMRFFMVQMLLLLLSAGFISFGVDHMKQNPSLTWIIVMSVITLLNYAAQKYWVF